MASEPPELMNHAPLRVTGSDECSLGIVARERARARREAHLVSNVLKEATLAPARQLERQNVPGHELIRCASAQAGVRDRGVNAKMHPGRCPTRTSHHRLRTCDARGVRCAAPRWRTGKGQIPVGIETAIVLGVFQRRVGGHPEHGLGRRDWPRARRPAHGQSAAQQRQQRRALHHVCAAGLLRRHILGSGVADAHSMGRKSKRDASAVAKVTCFYCTRQFDTESHLLLHQKSIHFKCPMCPRRFSSAFATPRC